MITPHDMPPGGYVTDYLVFWFVFAVLVTLTVLSVKRARLLGVTRLRLLVGNLLVVATLGWAAVLVGETWLRYVYDETDSYGLTLTNVAWFKRHWHINSWALRDREWRMEREAGVRRVLFLGDSFTAGYGVPETDDRFTDRIADELASRPGAAYDVWNAGVVGWSTGDELGWLREVQSTAKADHVVLVYCLNDADDLLPEDARFDRLTVDRPTWIHPWSSYLFDFLWFRIRLMQDTRVTGYFDWIGATYEDGPVWTEQRERLSSLAAFCTAEGIRLDVVVFPFFDQWGDDYALDVAHDRVVATCEELGMGVLDLREAYRGYGSEELVVNRFDAHPNEFAHGIAADAMLERLFADE